MNEKLKEWYNDTKTKMDTIENDGKIQIAEDVANKNKRKLAEIDDKIGSFESPLKKRKASGNNGKDNIHNKQEIDSSSSTNSSSSSSDSNNES